MSYTTLEVTEDAGIGRITFTRVERSNAIDLTTCEDLARAAQALARSDIRVVILTGAGKAFSVGGDIQHFVDKRASLHAEILAMTASFHSAITSFAKMPAPLLVAVNGVAAGGGFSLVCGADLAIAKRSAKLVSAYTRSGLTPDGGGTWFLPRLVGRQRAFEIMALNPTLTADEACRLGIVARVVDDADFDEAVNKAARTIADLPSGAARSLKRLLHASEERPLAAHLTDEASTLATSASSPETLAKLDAFLAK